MDSKKEGEEERRKSISEIPVKIKLVLEARCLRPGLKPANFLSWIAAAMPGFPVEFLSPTECVSRHCHNSGTASG